MTTTAELHTLAMDPVAFDTEVAALYEAEAKAERLRNTHIDRVHTLAGDRKTYVHGSRVPLWKRTYAEVMTDPRAAQAVADVDTDTTVIAKFMLAINEMETVYREYRWNRFFPSITKSHPHIHRSLTCHTLHADTQMSWAPQLSGRTDEEAVAELDEALCSVCFPTAPVALHTYVSRRSQAEQAERQAAKDERVAKALAKNLDGSEIFRSRRHDRITTVAACKELVRDAIEAEVELEWINLPARETEGTYPADMLARMRANRADTLEAARVDANTAAAILEAREAANAGWGADADAIAKMRANKRKSARKEWGL